LLRIASKIVIPAKAGIQANNESVAMDPRFRGGDVVIFVLV
jgi:hypothetical protein